jgi:hypothetical protein
MAKTRFFLVLFAVALSVTGWTGCGQGDDPTETSNDEGRASGGQGSTTTAAAGASSDRAARVVNQFLEAVRLGHTDNASHLLTPLALKRTSELELSFSPPGSDTARFAVGEVELVDQSRAIVRSIWTDLDADGRPSDEHITWALKLNDGRWRVSGMAAEIGPGQPPVVIDFENPQDLIHPEPTKTATKEPLRQASKQTRDPFQQTSPQ